MSGVYGGGPEPHLHQELALGIDSRRLLRALGPECDVCHLNEGHAVPRACEVRDGAPQASPDLPDDR
jgi:glucan phosphorylase